jgi:hypothetical protein
MGDRVGTLPVSAFVALILAILLIGGGVFLYRRAYVRSRAALVAIAILIALLVIRGMGLGVAPTS